MIRSSLLAILLGTAGCAKSIVSEFETLRDATLRPNLEVPPRWQPDAVLVLTDALLEPLLERGLERAGAFDQRYALGGGRNYIRPKLEITTLSLSESTRCSACLGMEASLSGEMSWQIANSSGSLPLGGELAFDAEIGAERRDDRWVVTLLPRDVTRADLEISGRTFRTVRNIAQGALDEWARSQIFSQIQPFVLTSFEAQDLPLRALRATPHQGGVQIEALTQAPITELAGAAEPGPGETWALSLSEQALLHMARVEAFNHGPVSHEVVVEPKGLTLRDGTFDLGLRLWRPVGRGWWRDLAIEGTWARTPRGFSLQAVEATEIARSRGARMVDPLAALAEGRILQAVERAVTTSLPGGQQGQIAGTPIQLDISRLAGQGRALHAAGTAEIGRAQSTRQRSTR